VELLDEGVEFLPWRGEGFDLDECAVFADDEVWGEDQPGSENCREHCDHEDEVYGCRDVGECAVGLDADGDGGADEDSELEDGPGEREGSSSIFLKWACHHDRTLSGLK
jgi:hypothetical protein